MAFLAEFVDHGPHALLHISDEGTRLDLEALISVLHERQPAIYACGPDRLMNALASHCAAAGRSAQLNVEHFSGVAPPQDPNAERAFKIELRRTGKTITVPVDKTILDVLHENGLDAPSSCGEGVCGSCETGLIEGRGDHRDSILDEQERKADDVIMICCSRSHSDDRPQWERLCQDPSLISNAVEEVLRFDSSVPAWRRTTTREVAIGGVTIPAGKWILLLTGSANHGEDFFPGSSQFDIERANADKHLSFDQGSIFVSVRHLPEWK